MSTETLRLRRFKATLDAIARWEKKERRAKNALAKLRKRRAYYMALGGTPQASALALEQRKANNKANKIARRIVALRDMPRTDDAVPAGVTDIVKALT